MNEQVKVAAFQDLMEHNLCFGCGAHNELGLQIKSYWEGDVAVCTFDPAPHHMAGPRHILNGGIIGTIIDCHCICTAIADAYRREGRDIGSDPMIWYATGSLTVDYKKPTPIDQPVKLEARIEEARPKKSIVTCTASSGGDVTAEGRLIAVRVPAEWFAGS